MEAGIEGIPAVYEVNGRQYVLFCVAANPSTRTHGPFYSANPGQARRGGPGDAEEAAPAGRRGGRGGRGGGRGGGTVQGAYVAFALPATAAR
jgi:hypothetical protein